MNEKRIYQHKILRVYVLILFCASSEVEKFYESTEVACAYYSVTYTKEEVERKRSDSCYEKFLTTKSGPEMLSRPQRESIKLLNMRKEIYFIIKIPHNKATEREEVMNVGLSL